MSQDQETLQERLRLRLPALWHFIRERFRHGERYGLDFTLAFAVVLAAVWVFAEIADHAITETQLNALDSWMQGIMAQLHTPNLTEIVIFITDLGGTRGTTIGVVLIGIPLLIRRRWWSAFGLVFATAGGGLVVLGLKTFFARARPLETVVYAGGYAFPSGHAFSAMVFFGYLIYLGYKHFSHPILHLIISLLSFMMIVLIGWSRVYLNVHWLTDVVGGFLAGIIWLALSILIVRHVEWPKRRALKREKHREQEARRSE